MLELYFEYPRCSGAFAAGRLAKRWTALRRISPSLVTSADQLRSISVGLQSSASLRPAAPEGRRLSRT